MIQILNNYTIGISEGMLGIKKRNPMLLHILLVFQDVPFKSWYHVANVIQMADIVKEIRYWVLPISALSRFGLNGSWWIAHG